MTAFERIDMAYRPQEVHDYGIDAHAELLSGGVATGQLLAIQLKTGASYFKEEIETGFVFRTDARHFEYWCHHALPVIVVLCDPEREVLYWQRVGPDTAESTGEGWKLIVPRSQQVDEFNAPHLRDVATRVAPKIAYSVLRQRDVSHGGAKRYSVDVLLNTTLTKLEIGAVVRQVTLDHIGSRYYRDHRVESRWGDVDAHVVWTFIYASFNDSTHSNWVCRSCWIDPGLPKEFRPLGLEGENIGLSIIVDWSKHYDPLATILAERTMAKSAYLAVVDRIGPLLEAAMKRVRATLDRLDHKEIGVQELDREMTAIEPEPSDLYDQTEKLGVSPLECRDLHRRLQTLSAAAHNAVLPFSERGQSTWSRETAVWLMRRAVQDFDRELIRFRFEREKV